MANLSDTDVIAKAEQEATKLCATLPLTIERIKTIILCPMYYDSFCQVFP